MTKAVLIFLLTLSSCFLFGAPYYSKFDEAYRAGRSFRNEGKYSESLAAFQRAKKLAKTPKEREKANDGIASVRSKTLENVLGECRSKADDDPMAWLTLKPELEEQLVNEKLATSQRLLVLDTIFWVCKKYRQALRRQAQLDIGNEDSETEKGMTKAEQEILALQEQLAEYCMQALEFPNLSNKEKHRILTRLYSFNFNGIPKNLDKILAIAEAEKETAMSHEEKEKVLALLTGLYFRQKNYEKTILYGEHYLKHVARRKWIMHDVIVSHYKLHHYDQAASLAERLLAQQNTSSDERFSEYLQALTVNILLKSYLEQAKYKKVITAGNKYVEQLFFPSQQEQCYETMFMAAVMGEMPDQVAAIALGQIESYEEKSEQKIKWELRYAQWLVEKKNYDEAIKRLTAVLESEEYSEQQKLGALNLMSRIYRETEDVTNQKKTYAMKKEYSGKEPAEVAAANAAYYLASGDQKKAEQCAEEGIKSKDSDAARWKCVSVLLRLRYRGKDSTSKEKIEFLERLQKEGGFSEPYQARMIAESIPCYYQQREDQTVVTLSRKVMPVLEKQPDQKTAYFKVVSCYLQSLKRLKQYSEVVADGEKLLKQELSPAVKLSVMDKMADALLKTGEPKKALAISQEMRSLGVPKSSVYPDAIAMQAYLDLGDYAAAETSAMALMKVSRRTTMHRDAWLILEQSAEKQKKSAAERLAIYDRALQDPVIRKHAPSKVQILVKKGELLLQEKDKGKLAELLKVLAPYQKNEKIPKATRNQIKALEKGLKAL